MNTSVINNENKLVGVLSEKDILKAASLMCIKKIRRIPVTDEENKLIGIISIGDVHKAIFQENLLKS